MKKAIIAGMLLATASAPCCAAADVAARGLIPPPTINIPYGGKVVTDINLSDGDVLGIIKQALPSMGDVFSSLAPMAQQATGDPKAAAITGMLANVDFKELAEAISGITNFRLVIAKFPDKGRLSTETVLEQFDQGVGKIGKFSRVASDVGMSPGAFGLYAAPNNAGYIGFAFDPGSRTLYAARVVGFVDVAKITKWVADVAKTAIGAAMQTPQPVEEKALEPEAPDAPEAPAEPTAPQ